MRRGVVAKRCGGEKALERARLWVVVAVCGSYADVRRQACQGSFLRAHCRW